MIDSTLVRPNLFLLQAIYEILNQKMPICYCKAKLFKEIINSSYLPINALDTTSGSDREINLAVVGLALIARNFAI